MQQNLMEVMPNLLSKRVFKPLATLRTVEMGYREAPGLDGPMCIVFVKVRQRLPYIRTPCMVYQHHN